MSAPARKTDIGWWTCRPQRVLDVMEELGQWPSEGHHLRLAFNRVVLTVVWRLLVFHQKRTSSGSVGMSQRCHRTKSLRSSPLRGSKSREAGSWSRERTAIEWWQGQHDQQARTVGVQRVIRTARRPAGHHPDAPSDNDRSGAAMAKLP